MPGTPAALARLPLARIVVLAVAAVLLCRGLTDRFTSLHEWNSAMYSVFARNHIAYGLGYTKLLCTWGDTVTPPVEPQRYLNHPPLIAAWVAIPMLVFGDHEWVSRSVPIVATLGSIWLLMVIVSRRQSPLLSLLAGLFYATLPATAYFGRMLDHVPLVQFFSLLMLHGYLQWSGLYGKERSPTAGAVWYTLGVVLGVGTGWAALIMAGLIWLWHVGRMWSNPALRRRLIWLTAVPALSLAAVVIHILWACGWDFGIFGPLVWSRTLGPQQGYETLQFAAWIGRLVQHMQHNVTPFAAIAAVLYLIMIAMVPRRTGTGSPWRQIVPSGAAVMPTILILLHGAIYVVAFKNQSGMHDYWQYFATPFFAVALAAVVVACVTVLSERSPRLARWAACVLIIGPMPLFARSLDWFHRREAMPRETITALVRLAELIPPRAAAMTGRQYPEFSESFGGYTNRWPVPEIAYYANRRLIYTTDIAEIEANRAGCAAYLLETTNSPATALLAEQLAARYEFVRVEPRHLIYLLNRPKPGTEGRR